MRRPALPVFVLLSAIAASLPHAAHAQAVHRCTAPDGTLVFTDRRCADVGAADSFDRTPANDVGHVPALPGCKRRLRDMVFEVSAAIDGHDANRLAGVYDWSGMSTGTGYALLGRLDAIVQRPLVDIIPVSPAEPAPGAGHAGESDAAAPAPMPVADAASQSPPVPRTPVALRVEQTLANGSTPARTVFGLRRNMGCWWITL